MKLWGGRFQKETDALVEDFHSSISFDQRLYRQDIRGSIAHARMLGRCGIISEAEADMIIRGLEEILQEIEAGQVEFDVTAEDIHMNIESLLTAKIGETGKKLHTARSRNDQVALDTRMYLKDEIKEVINLVKKLQEALVDVAARHVDTVLPGYTHLQRAQPVTFAHHLMAYFFMLQRDVSRLTDCYKRTDVMPLGSGALAGTPFPIDRQMVAEELGFMDITANSIDGVSDRDFVIEFTYCAAMIMMHLSRFCEELILWSSQEFAFIELDDAYTTGSSIMPQKKNPDVAELVRGKTGRVYGHLMGLLTMMKSLPLAYNKDMQEDKEAMFDSLDTVKKSLLVFAPMIKTMKVNSQAMFQAVRGGYTNATDAADYLVRQGMPFRKAHEVIGKMVFYCIERGIALEDLTLAQFQEFSELFGEDIYQVLHVKQSVAARNVPGGPAREQVLAAIDKARAILQED